MRRVVGIKVGKFAQNSTEKMSNIAGVKTVLENPVVLGTLAERKRNLNPNSNGNLKRGVEMSFGVLAFGHIGCEPEHLNTMLSFSADQVSVLSHLPSLTRHPFSYPTTTCHHKTIPALSVSPPSPRHFQFAFR